MVEEVSSESQVTRKMMIKLSKHLSKHEGETKSCSFPAGSAFRVLKVLLRDVLTYFSIIDESKENHNSAIAAV